ncbi:MAG: hypothetical protein LBQ07_02520 [Endomicrobium sp.]|jgi:DNA polymerase-1|nr:hypothetical protein [Endomicrobium sp.]
MKRFLIIDGNTYIYRSYYAIPPFFTAKNQQINAVYGFINLLLKINSKFNPDYFTICFDHPAITFRKKIFKNYKANRKPIDDALINQIPIIKEGMKALNINIIEAEGYEADDSIATLVEINKNENIQIIIVTGDKDILQLVNDTNILIWNDSKNIMYNAKKVIEKYGIAPCQLSDFFALTGDIADNIPGIKGIGKVTAMKLIKKFGNVENILQNINFINGKIGKLLLYGQDKMWLSKKLIKLNKQVPINYKLKNFENKNSDKEKAIAFFKKYRFKSLLTKYCKRLRNSS